VLFKDTLPDSSKIKAGSLKDSSEARRAPATQRNRVFANDGYMATQFFFRPEV